MSTDKDPKRIQPADPCGTLGEDGNPEESQQLVTVDFDFDVDTQAIEYSSAIEPNPYLTPEVLALVKDNETDRIDGKKQSGPAPADLGEHKPIPLDAVCASVVLSRDEEIEGNFDKDTEEMLDHVLKGKSLFF